MDIGNKVDRFLEAYGMSPEGIDINRCTYAFRDEMAKGLRGESSSLMMIPTYLAMEGGMVEGEAAIAVDAGGTNLRVALVRFEKGRPQISDFETHPMPGAQGEITRDAFLSAVAEYLTPVINKSDKIGFCFSYPAEILPDRDARVLYFNKEVRVSGSENMILCASLAEKLREKGIEGKRFVVLNDTAATLLGGFHRETGSKYDGAMGFILGTGTNTCYVEKVSEIGKLGGGNGHMIVNIEAAGFNRFELGEFERRFDADSAIPGDHLYEKLAAGAYQGGIIFLTVLQAAMNGLLSREMAARLKTSGSFSGAEVDAFCRRPFGGGQIAQLCETGADRETVYTIIDRSFERSARLATANLAGVMLKGDYGRRIITPARIVAEGSTFYKSKLFRGKLESYVKSYINDTLGRWCEFASAQDANLVGAAAAALLNS